MKLTNQDLKKLSQIAMAAAKEAGNMIEDYAGQEFQVERKISGQSLAAQVVTEVDRKSQDIILKHLEPTLKPYDLGILAEESEDDLSRFAKDYFWSVDPMDGTLPFVESRPGYAVSIGLVSKAGAPYIGVVYEPQKQILFHAIKGQGSFQDGEPWTPQTSQASTYEVVDVGGAVMNACWALEVENGCYFKPPKEKEGCGCVWDYAAVACIYENIGAWVSDMQGQPLELNRRESLYMNHRGILFANSEKIARSILEK